MMIWFCRLCSVCIEGPLSQPPSLVPGLVLQIRTEYIEFIRHPLRTVVCMHSNMTSFNSNINNIVIKLPIYFNSHMHIDKQILYFIIFVAYYSSLSLEGPLSQPPSLVPGLVLQIRTEYIEFIRHPLRTVVCMCSILKK
jgi:hypothetical protein